MSEGYSIDIDAGIFESLDDAVQDYVESAGMEADPRGTVTVTVHKRVEPPSVRQICNWITDVVFGEECGYNEPGEWVGGDDPIEPTAELRLEIEMLAMRIRNATPVTNYDEGLGKFDLDLAAWHEHRLYLAGLRVCGNWRKP